ncbi:MAG: class I tRNA ligase family protein, partial [Gemmatimonadota bacterium]
MGEALGDQKGLELASRYDPSGIEGALYDEWVDAGLFHVEPGDVDNPYVIVIPPPNVTAALHMGHGLNNTIQDVLIRRRRMQGYDTLYLPGTDHAGIATQNVVERQIRKEGKTRFDLGRDAFVERVWDWVGEYGDTIIKQLRVIGCSCDWERTRFTLDEGLSRAVRDVFVQLYERGLIYRGRYIINWCPRCGTALSNEEAEHRDHAGKLYRIRYPLQGEGERTVEVATTRPETMLGDTGLAVHPGDERYVGLVGQMATLPLVGRALPIVADDYVDPEFGTGVVKLTPAHDPNDFDIGRRHGLEALDVMTDAAEMNDEVPEAY